MMAKGIESQTRPILPGQTIGIYGGGQLGRMLAIVARRCGYRIHVFSNEPESPASFFANQVTVAKDDDEQAFRSFSESIDVLTFEFENVSSQSLQWVPDHVPIRPGANVFWTSQDRIREKTFLKTLGMPIPPFAVVNCFEDLQGAVNSVGMPAVLKCSSGGYDGKGQFLLKCFDQIDEAWQAVNAKPSTLEGFIDLDCEVSAIVARDVFGNRAIYGPIENRHANHILDLSFCPAAVSSEVAAKACLIAGQIAAEFDLVGLICVEFFVTRGGDVLVNEIAPRTHNSGHLTIESFATCQFEQQLRAVCGLPLGSAEQLRSAAMVNLLGDLWIPNEPDWELQFHFPETYLHLYDKPSPRVGRKMGHLTACAATVDDAIEKAISARNQISAKVS